MHLKKPKTIFTRHLPFAAKVASTLLKIYCRKPSKPAPAFQRHTVYSGKFYSNKVKLTKE